MDADGQHDPNDIPEFIKKLENLFLKLQLTLNTSSLITIATEIKEKIFGVNGKRTLTQLEI